MFLHIVKLNYFAELVIMRSRIQVSLATIYSPISKEVGLFYFTFLARIISRLPGGPGKDSILKPICFNVLLTSPLAQ